MPEKNTDLLLDLGEVALDAALDGGIIRDIPILRTLYAIVTTAKSFPERIFAAKIRRFLTRVSTATEQERLSLIKQLEDADRRKNLAEVIILALERIDRLDKAELLAMVFLALVRHQISDEEFLQLNSAILQSDLDVLRRFVDALHSAEDHNPKMLKIGFESLIVAGLTRGSGIISPDSSGTFTRVTDLGLKLYKILYESPARA